MLMMHLSLYVSLPVVGYVDPHQAIQTPQFWLLWTSLAMNTTCGLAIIGQASLMVQDMAGVNAQVAVSIYH